MLELVTANSTHPLHQRFLDPARKPGDRGRQGVQVTLPPSAP
jgi:hypothetical protein